MNLNSVFEDAWASFEAFRKLGFPSEDIYVVTTCDVPPHAMVRVRQQKKEFNFVVGPIGDLSAEQFGERWKSYAAAINGGLIPHTELERIYKVWLARCDVPGLMVALGRKGLSIPIARML